MLAAGIEAPHAMVILDSAVIVGKAAGLTVMILETGGIVLPKRSVAAQVSVTVPPQFPGVDERVEVAEPLIRHPPGKPLL